MENVLLLQKISRIQALRKLSQEGKIILWGRVVNEMLPEIYSRSWVCVIPSLKEEFGMVAIEAMLCGCPVIASRVGGLQDIVIHNKTGLLINKGDPNLLAYSLAFILKNKTLRNWMGKNARKWSFPRFTITQSFKHFIKLYNTTSSGVIDIFKEIRLSEHNNIIKALHYILKKKIIEFKDLSTSSNTTIHIKTLSKDFIAKIFYDKISSHSYMLFNFPLNSSVHSSKELLNRHLFFAGSAISPKVIQVSRKHKTIIYETLAKKYDCTHSEIIGIIEQLKSYGKTKSPHQSDLKVLLSIAYQAYTKKDIPSFKKYWMAGAFINYRITKKKNIYLKTHPQVDIAWMYSLVINKIILMGDELFMICSKVLKRALEYGFIDDDVWLTHGEIIDRHILVKNNRLYMCDYENSRYTIGEADIAVWLLNKYYWKCKSPSVSLIIHNILKFTNKKNTINLTCFWIISELAYRSFFLLLFKGQNNLKKDFDFINEFISACEKINLLGNKESVIRF